MKKVIPAILTNNIADLQNKLASLQGITDWVQIDIMDGKFVNSTSISIEDIANAPASKGFSLEAHLMVENPAAYFEQCQKMNIKRVVFHIEARYSAAPGEAGDIQSILQEALKFDFEIGVALNPETPVTQILPYIDKLDVILLMAVHPGKQGQAFIEETLNKIKELRQLAPNIKIEVDGGLNIDNIKVVSDVGADNMVVGSGLLSAGGGLASGEESQNIQERFEQLTQKIV